ncbi:MAG: magnesium transporter CorA family protein [Bacilli bacterium]|nr:magnesium transporter CorA family protein [Bacilli bacterium]
MIQIYKSLENKLQKLETWAPDTWVNVCQYTADELKIVSDNTNIQYSLLLKLLDHHEIARIEVRDGDTLIVLKMPVKTSRGYRTIPLGIIVGEHHIVTVCQDGEAFFQQMIANQTVICHEKTNFTIQVFLKVASSYLIYLQALQTSLEKKERALYQATNNNALKGLLQIEKSLVYFINALNSNEIVLERITMGTVLPLYQSDNILLEDAIIENKQAIAMASLYQALLASLTESYGTIISNNLNQVMKFLAGITIVFSIPTMISSFMGMNVPLGFFSHSVFAFSILVILSLIISMIVAYIFKRKNWL